MSVGARTRHLGVVGWPVAHSRSPAMHNAAFAALGLDLVYGAFAVEPARLARAIDGAGALGFVGLNVTVPHKEAALARCRPDELARRVGAVNTLVFDGAAAAGTNTDVHGFRLLLVEAGVDARGMRAVVLGAGGAARAVVVALRDAGADVTVVSRSGRRVGLAEGDPPHVAWEARALDALLPSAQLLVDATPRGLDDAALVSDEVLRVSAACTVVDLVARPTTPLVAAARARGLRAVTGEAMLVHQGAAAFERWTGRPAPVDVMRAALRD